MKYRQSRGMLVYVVAIGLFILLYYLFAGRGNNISGYTYGAFVSDLRGNNISAVTLRQNTQVPTGEVIVKFNSGQTVSFYDTDVASIREMVSEQYPSVSLLVEDVRQDSLFLPPEASSVSGSCQYIAGSAENGMR